MRIVALLNWYDEPTPVLSACIEGLGKAGVDHLVAVDGAYASFPDGKRASPSVQRKAIDDACQRFGISCTVHTPTFPWAGDEVEKRTFMHKLALSVSKSDDWHLVMDADQVVTKVPSDLRRRLRATSADVGEVSYSVNGQDYVTGVVRSFFRAIPIFLERNHYTYVTSGGRVLWAAGTQPQEGAADLKDFVMDHRPAVGRSPARIRRKNEYYAIRDEGEKEKPLCQRCSMAAHKRLPTKWRLDGEYGYVADWIEVCTTCGHGVDKENKGAMAAMGLDPTLVSVVAHDNYALGVPQDGRGLPDKFREWLEVRS